MVLRPHQASCRVISAEAKSSRQPPPGPHPKSTIAGVLDVGGGGSHYAEVKEGILMLHRDACPSSPPQWRIPLRGLDLLQASPLGLAFALSTPGDSSPTVTFQVKSEFDYERWVKCLAVELMRQTPLERVRFLDILGITGSLGLRRSRSAECVSSEVRCPDIMRPTTSNPSPVQHGLVYRKRSQQLPDVVRDLPPCSRRSRSRKKEMRTTKARGQSLEPLSPILVEPHNPQVTELLSKCQRGDVYVPVKEKRMLFESLWKRENCNRMTRTQSLHDLSPHHPVKDIARYFEMKTCPSPKLLDMGVSMDNVLGRGEPRYTRDIRLSDVKITQFNSFFDKVPRR